MTGKRALGSGGSGSAELPADVRQGDTTDPPGLSNCSHKHQQENGNKKEEGNEIGAAFLRKDLSSTTFTSNQRVL